MENFVDYDNLISRINNAKADEEKRLKEAKRQRNVAAFIDFASNLISLAGYSKGSRHLLGTSLLSKQQPLYLQTKQNYEKAMNDYNGKIAEIGLLKKMNENKKTIGMRPIGFIGNDTRKQVRPFSTGTFESALKDYKKNYNRKNYKL